MADDFATYYASHGAIITGGNFSKAEEKFTEKDVKSGVVLISRYKKFSVWLHAGIISIENGVPYLYDNDPDSPINDEGGNIRRISLSDHLKKYNVIEFYNTGMTSDEIKEKVKKI